MKFWNLQSYQIYENINSPHTHISFSSPTKQQWQKSRTPIRASLSAGSLLKTTTISYVWPLTITTYQVNHSLHYHSYLQNSNYYQTKWSTMRRCCRANTYDPRLKTTQSRIHLQTHNWYTAKQVILTK